MSFRDYREVYTPAQRKAWAQKMHNAKRKKAFTGKGDYEYTGKLPSQYRYDSEGYDFLKEHRDKEGRLIYKAHTEDEVLAELKRLGIKI